MTPKYFHLKDISYDSLTSELVERLSPHEAEYLVAVILSERARIREGGKILAWSEFNENPDPLINKLLAKILIARIPPEIFENSKAHHVAILSIENSAGYLASELTHALQTSLRYERPPRIIRARKTAGGKPSPAMGDLVAYSTVYPITAGGSPRHLIASLPRTEDLKDIRVILAVDDFRATGSSLKGGVDLAQFLLKAAGSELSRVTIVPLAGLGKPEQIMEQSLTHNGAAITDVYTAADVRFWPNNENGTAMIAVNDFEPMVLRQATASDFSV